MKLILIIAVICVAGCSLIPATKTGSESIKGAQALASTNALAVHKVIEGTKPLQAPNITITGSSNSVVIPTRVPIQPYREETTVSASGGVAARSDHESTSFWSSKLPVGYTLCLAGVGVLVCIFAFNRLKNSSATIRAGFDFADTIGSNSIRRFKSRIASLQDRAGQATDPTEIANAFREIHSYQAEITEIEGDRGKAAKRRPTS